ncbi:MAG: hypothetical protein IPH54_15400 [Rhodoferax sp.]|nr:hypothetical protein [Rhodoferax sp.]
MRYGQNVLKKDTYTMALLLPAAPSSRVKFEGDTAALYEAGERRGTVPIKLIDRCVIEAARPGGWTAACSSNSPTRVPPPC